MELDFGGAGGVGLLGRPISRWTLSPLAWEDKDGVLAFLDFTTHVRGKKGVTDLTPHLYDLCSLLWGPVAQVLLVDG